MPGRVVANVFTRLFSHDWAHNIMAKASELTAAMFQYAYQHQHVMMLGKAVRKGIVGA